MKQFIKNNIITLTVIGGSAILCGGIIFLSKPLSTPEETVLEKKVIVPVTGNAIKLYETSGIAKSVYEGENTLAYTFSFPSSVLRESKNDGRQVSFFYNGVRVAVLNFSYEGGRGYSPLDYTQNVLGQKIPLAIDKKEIILGDYSYITASSEKSYFRVSSFKKGEWLGALEILDGNDALEKIVLGTLKVK